ncbi:tripartite tricarboxylate transporter TctB family protein [Acidimangrovimonas sediminis]|uniref:tripartite tricarboxylate transporter TctB family protein n=1 Tax=Acidimangrovimonas sediminis TaxID=2056283 RepID=UPI000C7FF033|nr:tripartite tricarboxylate transporter TctB family protein [Acidimangrovimonas sediminis]
MSDRIFGAVGLLLAAFYAYAATLIQESFLTDTVGPKAFPFIIAGVLALASIAIILRPDAEPQWPALPRLVEILAAVVVMLIYAQTLKIVGFVIATTVASAYLSWRLGSKPLAAVLAGIGTAVGIYIVFHLALGLSLARGPFGF